MSYKYIYDIGISHSDSDASSKLGKIGSVVGGGIILSKLAKLKWLFGALKLGKFASLGSMLFSSLAYSFIFGWKYAIGSKIRTDTDHSNNLNNPNNPT